jgi:hypothetical protein
MKKFNVDQREIKIFRWWWNSTKLIEIFAYTKEHEQSSNEYLIILDIVRKSIYAVNRDQISIFINIHGD